MEKMGSNWKETDTRISRVKNAAEEKASRDEDEVVREIVEESGTDGKEDVEKCLVRKVLSGKKVNKDAFKGLIEQIWSPFGQVEVELVRDNTFMFYFDNRDDRNQVWQRGPWHFGNNLIALEKPLGLGNISNLGFNRADFWIQIHDIPIGCMNRKMAKWLAEQLGEVLDIPAESRECWGKFMRVRVRIDISKPLKRWLKLKSGLSDEVFTLGLKYEKLPDFCFAYGRIGHGIKECVDEAARILALDGSQTKFGSWLKAPIIEKSKIRTSSFMYGSSSDRSKSIGASRDTTGEGSVSLRPKSQASQKVETTTKVAAEKRATKEDPQLNLNAEKVVGPQIADVMWVDGPGLGILGPPKDITQPNSDSLPSSYNALVAINSPGPSLAKGIARPNQERQESSQILLGNLENTGMLTHL
ncbi:hypothetical protein EZV62_009419 [Acer yangbiense]|uniref:DUF4283 domain-containing protein n=1 Tax=Acer yangbiense TaxID=1000413 RepID=A0A5C7HZZ0_9ROSI|nr:hypothetical protein EZV62_009419 [Acer yangbiense]